MKEQIFTATLSAQYKFFSFSSNEFESMKVEEDEFIYEGKMYDIVKAVSRGAIVTVSCIYDRKETNIIAILGDFLSQGTHSERTPYPGNTITLLKFLQTVFIVPSMHIAFSPPINMNPSRYPIYIYKSPSLYLLDSPPESRFV